jgi:phosphatidylserine/phosphatidylglycerophosphate/cardiolipin synthase-like enzyme
MAKPYIGYKHILFCIIISALKKKLTISEAYFPEINVTTEALVQIAGSGPDSERATLMLAFFTAIVGATERVYITTPYLIPNESIITALKQAVLSGLDVRLLVPKNSDSFFVNAASQSFFNELLEAGVKIYQYDKGFIHAKTMVIDNNLAIVGTANMDIRSFDLNFEINAFIYDTDINQKLADTFMDDLKKQYINQYQAMEATEKEIPCCRVSCQINCTITIKKKLQLMPEFFKNLKPLI